MPRSRRSAGSRPDLLLQFRDPDGGNGEPIEGKRVGSVAALGYRVKKKRFDVAGQAREGMRVYVDPASDLPVRVEAARGEGSRVRPGGRRRRPAG